MIFKFLKRSPPPAPAAKAKPRRKQKDRGDTTLPMLPPDSVAAFEVTEGSEHEDWALWENSVAEMDSQLSSILPEPTRRFRHEPETPTEFQEIEAFARVKNKDP